MMSKLPQVLIISTLAMAGCEWVDSTGSSAPVRQPTTGVFLDDTPIGRAIVVNENSAARVTATRDNLSGSAQTFSWSSEPLQEGALSICGAVNGFDSAIAAESFQEACTRPNDCSLNFEQIDSVGDEVAEFLMSVPELKASVGVLHTLTVTDQSGDTDTSDYEFCLLAVNEAPDANDDTFVVLEGGTLEVSASVVNLLSNDTDDIDVRNLPLRVNRNPIVAPQLAESFDLRADGGFTYESRSAGARRDVIDTFEYEITDGLFFSRATASIRIVASNLAPAQLSALTAQTASVGQFFVLDLAPFFSDPEGSALAFFAAPATLPQSGSLQLSRAGVLSGTPVAGDVGQYEILITASDGSIGSDARLMLSIIDETPVIDTSGDPVYVPGSVADQVVTLGRRIDPVIPEFEDPDGDELVYRSAGTTFTPGLTLDLRTGVLSGRPSMRGLTRGMRIRATDPDGNTAISERFAISVQ